jgi:hypothetical protein
VVQGVGESPPSEGQQQGLERGSKQVRRSDHSGLGKMRDQCCRTPHDAFLLGLLFLSLVLSAMGCTQPGNASPPLDDILIKRSGATNTPPSTLVVHPDGSGEIAEVRSYPPGYFDRSQVDHDLAQVENLGLIELRGACIHPASFGGSITVTWRGRTSPDLTCPDQLNSDSARTLSRDVLELDRKAHT